MPAGTLYGASSKRELFDMLRKIDKDQASVVEARMALADTKATVKKMSVTAKEQAVAFRNQYKNTVAGVMLVAPVGAAIGMLIADWLHDKVVEKLGKDNFATPYVVPIVGVAVAALGYTMKGKDLDVRAFVTGLGVGLAAQGAKRSYTDFWSKP